MIYGTFIVGILALLAFIGCEHRVKEPMMPLGLFKERNFSVGNVATFMIYGGLSIAELVIVVFFQQVGHYRLPKPDWLLLP